LKYRNLITSWLQKLQPTQSNLNLSPAEKYYETQRKILEAGVNFPSTWFELDWVRDWDFNCDVVFEEPHFRNTFRRYFLSQVVALTGRLNLEGLNIEFGVFNGYGSKLILENSTRDLLLVDTFNGMSQPLQIDGKHWSKGDMARELTDVQERLSSWSHRTTYFVGEIPGILNQLPAVPIVFGHIDVDLYTPTFHSLKWLSERLVSGGMIICDDYGFETCPGATKACDQFISENPSYSLLPMPVGGALLLKTGF
jgi:hypothetical protein